MSSQAAEKSRINNALGTYGLPQLGTPGLNEALAFLVGEDEQFFRELLNKCDPPERRNMYEALRPHLAFRPQPLDVYVSQLGDLAERKQLPTVGDDGTLRAFHPPVIESEDYRAAAQAAIDGAITQVASMTLTCRKCTRTETFPAQNKADAIHAARMAGWTYGLDPEGKGRELCPECPAVRN